MILIFMMSNFSAISLMIAIAGVILAIISLIFTQINNSSNISKEFIMRIYEPRIWNTYLLFDGKVLDDCNWYKKGVYDKEIIEANDKRLSFHDLDMMLGYFNYICSLIYRKQIKKDTYLYNYYLNVVVKNNDILKYFYNLYYWVKKENNICNSTKFNKIIRYHPYKYLVLYSIKYNKMLYKNNINSDRTIYNKKYYLTFRKDDIVIEELIDK